MQQPHISPALSALFELQREASKGQVSLQTDKGLPTIAGNLMAQQKMGAPGEEPQGGPPPSDQQGLMGIVQNAQSAGPSLAALQQQQAAPQGPPQGQPPPPGQGPPPGPPQGMAQGGIAGLPANNMRGFKRGGVLGFETGDPVYGFDAEATPPPVVIPSDAGRKPSPRINIDRETPTFVEQPVGFKQGQLNLATAPTAPVKAKDEPFQYPLEIAANLAESKALRAQQMPAVEDRQKLLKAFDEKFKHPADEERKRISGLGGLQQEILDRQKALYDKEVAGRESEGFSAYLRGAAAGPGRGPAAVAAHEKELRGRDEARTKEMSANVEFQKGIATLQHSTDKDEYTDNLTRVANSVTDSQQAAKLFETDRTAKLVSLRGDLGPQMQAWAHQHDAKIRAETRSEAIAAKNQQEADKIAQRQREAVMKMQAHINSDAVRERIAQLPAKTQSELKAHATAIQARMIEQGADANDPSLPARAFDEAMATKHASGIAATAERKADRISKALETAHLTDMGYLRLKSATEKTEWDKRFIAAQNALRVPDATPTVTPPPMPAGYSLRK